MTDKYIVRSGATTNTLLKGQLRMKVNFSLVLLGAVAASAIALPAQAATVRTTATPPGGGTTALSAYGIDAVEVTFGGTTSLYNVTFERDSRANIYGNPTPEYGLFADAIGEAIVTALRLNPVSAGGAITSLVDITQTTPGTNVPTDFYIPQSNTNTVNPVNTNERLLTHCFTARTTDACDINLANGRDQDEPLMYAKWGEGIPINPGTTPGVPTPALIPGLLGMGLAAMRKKQQAAIVAQEA
jgi:hypothetical protein